MAAGTAASVVRGAERIQAGRQFVAETATGDVPPPPAVTLGSTGVKMTRLGQGTGVHGGNRQSDQSRMGFAKLVDLFHHA
jgi:hypothetical protein